MGRLILTILVFGGIACGMSVTTACQGGKTEEETNLMDSVRAWKDFQNRENSWAYIPDPNWNDSIAKLNSVLTEKIDSVYNHWYWKFRESRDLTPELLAYAVSMNLYHADETENMIFMTLLERIIRLEKNRKGVSVNLERVLGAADLMTDEERRTYLGNLVPGLIYAWGENKNAIELNDAFSEENNVLFVETYPELKDYFNEMLRISPESKDDNGIMDGIYLKYNGCEYKSATTEEQKKAGVS